MADEFEKQKRRSLNQVDLSKKGSIDEHIVDLVQHINCLEHYFTTSSCSGRICVFSEDTDQKKKSGRWLFVSHDIVKEESVLSSIGITEGSAVLKFEPFVLHVQCRMLEDAQAMLKVALESGYKNSGIVVGKKQRFILAVRSTQSLDVPIIHNGKLMVSSEYIKFLVEMANTKMEENLSRIQRFFENVKYRLHKNSETDKKEKQKRENCKEKLKSKTLESQTTDCDAMDDILETIAGIYEEHVS